MAGCRLAFILFYLTGSYLYRTSPTPVSFASFSVNMTIATSPRERVVLPGSTNGASDDDGPSGLEAQRPTLSDRLPRPWLFPLLAFTGAWILILATWQLDNLLHHQSHGWTWYFWYKDANYYSAIAGRWYAQPKGTSGAPEASAFFPLFPALIWLCRYLVFGSVAWAGLIANVASGGAATVLVWALAGRVRDRWTADRAVLLFCAFPGAMMFASMYSEPLGIALTAACLLAAVTRKWFLAGLFALLATAEHSTFIVLAPALGGCALHAIWTRRDWRSLIAPALAPLGMAGYFGWIGTRYHDYFFWFQVEHKYWLQKIDFGKSLFGRLTFNWTGPWGTDHGNYIMMLDIMFWIMLIGIILMIAARVPLPVCLYTILLFIDFVIDNRAGPRPRFAWTGIGIYIGAAIKLPRWLYWLALAVSAAGLCFLVAWCPYHPKTNP
jgi:hypothetical protein